jgi:hypothetical protein
VLIPVRHLIDGDAIAQMSVDHITYFHVELTAHDVLLAEGLPVESYLENGDRDSFIGAGRRSMATEAMLAWEALGCAPLVVTGPPLETARDLISRQGGSREGGPR